MASDVIFKSSVRTDSKKNFKSSVRTDSKKKKGSAGYAEETELLKKRDQMKEETRQNLLSQRDLLQKGKEQREGAIKKDKTGYVSTTQEYLPTGRVKETQSFQGPDGMVNLPEGVKVPQKFLIGTDEESFDMGGQSISIFGGTKQVSPADYYGSLLNDIDAQRAARGDPPLTIEERNKIVMDKIVNSPINTKYGEILQKAAKGEISIDDQKLADMAKSVGQQITPTEQQLLMMTPEQREEFLTNANAQGVDISQALLSGAATAVPGIIGGLVAGATVGALGGPIGVVGGAVLGALGAFIGGTISNMRNQYQGNIQAEFSNLERSSTNLRAIIQDTNGGGNVAENMQLFNHQLMIIDDAYSKLHLQTHNNLSKFLGKDGTPELEKFENFYSMGGMRSILVNEMQQAVLNPNPQKQLITAADLQ